MPEQRKQEERIEPGMTVEATEGDLGEQDVSKPKVTRVERDAQGHAERLVVKKGAIFQKELDIPADRVQAVEPGEGGPDAPGKVLIDASEAETEALAATGVEELAHEADALARVEEEIPTAEGLREKELSNILSRKRGREEGSDQEVIKETRTEQQRAARSPKHILLHLLGPGFLAGMAGNDASAVGAYSIDGATNGFGHLWLMLLSTPLYFATQYACANIGRVTRKGLAELLRESYGRWAALLASLVLIVANIALISADLAAIGNGLQILSGPLNIAWWWFVVPVGAILWYLTVYRSFNAFKRIFIILSLAFVAYVITGLLSRPNWSQVLFYTFVPHLDLTFASVSSAVALLGATISPYTIFWQVQGEKEEDRPGEETKQQLRFAALDIGIGVVSGNLVSYFIILSTATTLFSQHKQITTATDAAQALVPILGPYAEVLFALGFIGAGTVAIPVLLASTSYAVSGSFGWPAGLAKKPWQNEGFYLILTLALLASALIALVHIDPIQLLFWANVLNGVLAPIMVIFLMIVGLNRRVMKGRRLGPLTMIGLVVTTLLMLAAAALLFYGIFTGQSR